MCRKRNRPIEAKYHNSFFGDRADHCMVGAINRHVGYYTEAAKLNIVNINEIWRGDDLQMDEGEELLVHRQ
jgi:hypothetical protein